MQYTVNSEPHAGGWRFSLVKKSGWPFAHAQRVPLSEWDQASPHHLGVALLLSRRDQDDAQPDGDGFHLVHERVARLSGIEAGRLGLPPISPFTLFLSREAPISDPQFAVGVQWLERGGGPIFVSRREGTCLEAGGRRWLLLEPLFSLVEAIDALNASAKGSASPDGALDRRMVAFAAFRERLNQVTGDARADDYLQGLTIHHATGFGVDLAPEDGQPFIPTLYGDRPLDQIAAENETPEIDREPLLPQVDAGRFQKRFFQQGSRRHYFLGTGVYAVLDAPVTAALEVVERVNQSDPTTRQAFQKDPLSFLMPAIDAAGGGGDVVCDLRGYGERVIGIGLWEQAKLSFRLPVSREWFPPDNAEVFTIEIPGGEPLVIRQNEINDVKEIVAKAQQCEATEIQVGRRIVSLTAELAKTIHGLVGYVCPSPDATPPHPRTDPAPPTFAARNKENHEALVFRVKRKEQERNPKGTVAPFVPKGLLSTPKPHQTEAITWMQTSYLAGTPGLLLADDMGLGKTFQVLAFLRWLRDTGCIKARRPVLIVAPKTLLDTWREELEQHLGTGTLGPDLRLFEDGVKKVKVHSGAGNDISLSRATLDVAIIESASLVLTTYETLRDYHLSFGKIRFSVIVYDEAQKLKNPVSLMNTGAKAQQGDFILGVTGTPIENHILDLWTLLDIVWPGFLDTSAKEFVAYYGIDDPERREKVRRWLIEPTPVDGAKPIPPVMLRRFKTDILQELPERRVEVIREPMPPVQRLAYDAMLSRIQNEGRPAIGALQDLRTVSLHPALASPPQGAEDQYFIAASARFTSLFRILDQIKARKEKALVFVELRNAQAVLTGLIQRRYQLTTPQPQTINGETAAPARKRIRDAFQQRKGFDVLILGPKAAGFGLTLTAANHVIHLNRWWNPAVEDQCSDRVYRIGQGKPVTIYLPLAIHPEVGNDSFDQILHNLLEEKRKLSREILVPVQINEKDIGGLFDKLTLVRQLDAPGLLSQIDNMDWLAFEIWVADVLRVAGCHVSTTPKSADKGADIIASLNGGKSNALILQCKHRSRGATATIGRSVINELLIARERYELPNTPSLVAVSNAGDYDYLARRAAKKHGVLLVDRNDLSEFPQNII